MIGFKFKEAIIYCGNEFANEQKTGNRNLMDSWNRSSGFERGRKTGRLLGLERAPGAPQVNAASVGAPPQPQGGLASGADSVLRARHYSEHVHACFRWVLITTFEVVCLQFTDEKPKTQIIACPRPAVCSRWPHSVEGLTDPWPRVNCTNQSPEGEGARIPGARKT